MWNHDTMNASLANDSRMRGMELLTNFITAIYCETTRFNHLQIWYHDNARRKRYLDTRMWPKLNYGTSNVISSCEDTYSCSLEMIKPGMKDGTHRRFLKFTSMLGTSVPLNPTIFCMIVDGKNFTENTRSKLHFL